MVCFCWLASVGPIITLCISAIPRSDGPELLLFFYFVNEVVAKCQQVRHYRRGFTLTVCLFGRSFTLVAQSKTQKKLSSSSARPDPFNVLSNDRIQGYPTEMSAPAHFFHHYYSIGKLWAKLPHLKFYYYRYIIIMLSCVAELVPRTHVPTAIALCIWMSSGDLTTVRIWSSIFIYPPDAQIRCRMRIQNINVWNGSNAGYLTVEWMDRTSTVESTCRYVQNRSIILFRTVS